MTNGIICKDHKGTEYSSVSEMCKAYNIGRSTFQQRIQKGMSLEEALTAPLCKSSARANKCVDYLGNEYSSEAKMCEKYGINFFTYRERKMKGWSIEDCLTKSLADPSQRFSKECVDHKGNKYKSEADMAKAWGITPRILATRKSHGWTLEEALTTPLKDVSQTDHKGNVYPTLYAMCDAYGLSVSTYQRRKSAGWSLEKALTTPGRSTECQDHTGTSFSSFEKMAKAWGLSSGTVKARLERGWTLEEALTSKRNPGKKSENNGNPYVCHDHKGNEYPSQKAMCKAYGVSFGTFQKRIKKGMSIEEALTSRGPHAIQDHLGNWYSCPKEMAKAYGVNSNTLISRLYHGIDVKTALTMETAEKTDAKAMKEMWEGVTRRMNCGLDATVKEYINRQKMIIRFEDGAYKVSDLRSFENGNVGHPELSHGKPFHGYKCKYLYEVNGEVYYEAVDIKTEEKNVMTVKELIC